MFERHFRVHMNTLEQLVMFLPALWIFAHFVSPIWAAALGVVFIIGRAIYARAYVRDPKSRSLGFALTALPTLVMMIGILIWARVGALIGRAGARNLQAWQPSGGRAAAAARGPAACADRRGSSAPSGTDDPRGSSRCRR